MGTISDFGELTSYYSNRYSGTGFKVIIVTHELLFEIKMQSYCTCTQDIQGDRQVHTCSEHCALNVRLNKNKIALTLRIMQKAFQVKENRWIKNQYAYCSSALWVICLKR